MPYLIIAALIAFGVWEYRRYRSGLPLLPGAAPASPEQVVRAEIPPALQNAILDLIYNGRDPESMNEFASELERYGFFDAAMLLHKRADALVILQRQVDAILTSRGLNPVTATPALREAVMQEILRGTVATPGTTGPSVPAPPSALEVGFRELRNEIGVLDTEYGALDRQIKALPSLTAQQAASWNTAITSWRNFAVTFERIQPTAWSAEFFRDLTANVASFRQTLETWRSEYARALGVQAPVPQAPPGPAGGGAEVPAGTVPTFFSSRGTVVSGPVLNLRSRPDFTSAIVTSAPIGASIVVTSSSGDFYLVTYQDKTGWAPKAGVSIAADPRATIPGAAGGILRGAR